MTESLQEIGRLVERLSRSSIKAGGGHRVDDRIMRYEDERKTAKLALLSAITRVVGELETETARAERHLGAAERCFEVCRDLRAERDARDARIVELEAALNLYASDDFMNHYNGLKARIAVLEKALQDSKCYCAELVQEEWDDEGLVSGNYPMCARCKALSTAEG